MMASRGMGDIAPSKMPKGVKKARRDDTDFTQYAEGGMIDPEAGYVGNAAAPKLTDEQLATRMAQAQRQGASTRYAALKAEYDQRQQRFAKTRMAEGGKVNAAGNYTKPSLRKRIVSQVKAAATHGTGAGQWSARKAQLVAKKYKAAGGSYRD
jgi:hypothetical protein